MFKLGTAGLVSGLISSILYKINPGLLIIAGINFGVTTLLVLRTVTSFKENNLFKSFLWVFLSFSGYSISLILIVYLSLFLGELNMEYIGVILAGMAGSFFILLSFNELFKKISTGSVITLTLLGGLLSLSYYFNIDKTESNDLFGGIMFNNPTILYIVWQTGMAAGLGWVIDKKGLPSVEEVKNKSQENTNNN